LFTMKNLEKKKTRGHQRVDRMLVRETLFLSGLHRGIDYSILNGNV
jgi:hypothetical protein